MDLKTTKTLIMLVALAALLSTAVFMLSSCALTEARKSNPGPHATEVKACNPGCTNPSCCAAKKEAKTCPAEKEGNPHPAEHPKLDCGAKKEGNPHSSNPSKSSCDAKKEAKTCSGDK